MGSITIYNYEREIKWGAKMKKKHSELKILGVVVFLTLVTYWGVEPYAHSVMHKHVEFKGFKYDDLKPIKAKGNPENGKALVSACAGCHSIKAANMPAPMDPVTAAATYGVNPPDLSLAGALLDEKFLANFLKDPVHTALVAHKFKNRAYPMPSMASDDQSAADIVAYLKSIAPKEVKPKEAYEFACGRCHEMRYAKWTQIGEEPKTKPNIQTKMDEEKLKFQEKVAEYKDHLVKYIGKLPPDLSIIVRARSEDFLKTFVEDPQSQLPGTAMPRVGLSNEGYEKVYKYLEEIGDPSKPKREKVGPWVLAYFAIFTVLAYLWYKSQWKGLK